MKTIDLDNPRGKATCGCDPCSPPSLKCDRNIYACESILFQHCPCFVATIGMDLKLHIVDIDENTSFVSDADIVEGCLEWTVEFANPGWYDVTPLLTDGEDVKTQGPTHRVKVWPCVDAEIVTEDCECAEAEA